MSVARSVECGVEPVRKRPPSNRRRARRGACRVGLLGYGRVGQAVATWRRSARHQLLAAGIDLDASARWCAIRASRDRARRVPLSTTPTTVVRTGYDVIVEVLGGVEPARATGRRALDAGIPVVTANKTLVAAARSRAAGPGARRRTPFAFDAAVLAGVPFLGTLSRRPLVGSPADRRRLNGTSQFHPQRNGAGASFDDALTQAVVRGYAEPDSSADVSGLDAAQKLSVLLQLVGCGHMPADLPRAPLTILDPRDLRAARRLGGAIKPIALPRWRAPPPARGSVRRSCARAIRCFA